MRFFLYTEHAEICDLGIYLQEVEGHEVVVYIEDHNYRRCAEGMLEHTTEWWRYIGEGYIWLFDGCSHGDLISWLREQGEDVVGGTKESDLLENDRQEGQRWFRRAGFDQPWSQNFTDLDEVLAFVEENPDQKYILKQNGDAPKHLSHKGKFANSVDMIFHLRELKKHWNEMEFGKFDCDLMEVVEGLEVAASAFWNGEDWLRNSAGKVVGYLNFEEKKEANGATGETCGEMGTTFIGVDEDDGLFTEILLRGEIKTRLRDSGFRGVFDINCIRTDNGRLVALEPTCRFGVPASSYELLEGLQTPLGELLSAMAKGINRKIEIHEGVGMVMCVVAKPFPLEVDVEPDGTSIGEKLWIMQEGKPIADFTDEQRQHIHLYNFEKAEDPDTGEICYKVPTKSGYLLTVTARGEHVSLTRDALIHYIKQNIFFPGMKYRTDIGARVEAVEMEFEAAQ